MLRIIATILVLFLGFSSVYSQKLTPKYQMGLKIAATGHKSRFNFPEDEDQYDQRYRFGYQVGGVIDLPLANIFHFYAELYYARKGKSTLITSSGLRNISTYNYLEAPILLRFSFNGGKVPSGNFNWHLDVGPSISYWFGGKGRIQADGPVNKYKIKFGPPPVNNSDFNTMYVTNENRWQWALNVGVGIDYPVTKGQMVYIDLRSSFGGTDLGQHDSEVFLPVLGFSDAMQVRYLEFVVSVAYTFEIDWISTLKGKSTNKKRRQY